MPLSVRECLMRYCDLTGPLRRSDLKVFAAYANLPTDQKALLRWASKDGKTEFKEKIQDGYIGLVDLLKRCPSINMPLEHFLNVVPMIQTRFFTISSSSSVHPNSIHMTVAVNKTTRPNGTTFEGVCSNYLAGCKPSESVIRVYNRASTFRLPKITSTPIILIGPGTGIAPMRALLQERQYQRLTLKQPVGRNILYFGCKKEDEDYLYENEFKALQESGDLHELHVAFSRAQNEKVYVQHLLRAQEAATWKLVDAEGAFIYICGAVKMGGDVAETLRQIIATQGQMSSDQAKDYLTKMSAEGRFVQELWA
jgi:NADPH-ferrihemoprotein reductase